MKKNNLAECNPELAKEWHPTLNGDLTPWDVTCGSGKKVWWGCKNGHEWEAMISNRNKGNSCPYCSNQIVLSGYNDLETTNPELAKEWSPKLNKKLVPSDVIAGSSKKVWWQCNKHKNHQWKATIGARNNGGGCIYCSNQKVLSGYNDLATTNPELAKEWHPTLNEGLTMKEVFAGSSMKVWWQCSKGHGWKAPICNRNGGSGCPYCSGRCAIIGVNDLETINPTLAKEWHSTKNHNLTPNDVLPSSNKKVWWICTKGHEWQSIIGNRTKERGCPYCSNRKVLSGYNDLATTNPELAKEWHPLKNGNLTSNSVTAGFNRKVWWQCNKQKEHEWMAIVGSRNSGSGCPYCSNNKVSVGYNDLATTNPELAKEWHPSKNGELTPFDVTAGSNKKAWWQCRKGHEWEASISNRNKKRGCNKCNAGKQTSFPEQAVYFYLKQVVAAESRASVFGVEVDVFIPSWNIGIEYDGLRFHNSDKSAAREAKKNKIMSENGINLIRIKESKEVIADGYNIIYCVPDAQYNYLESTLNILAEVLAEMRCTPITLDVNIERDRIKVMEQYIENEKEHSLAINNPTVASEWHPTKNGRIKPDQVSFSSAQKVWWQCGRGHEWQASIKTQNKGSHCPYCSNRILLVGFNDLETTNPELASEWHPILNGDRASCDVTYNANKECWWQCRKHKEHAWMAKVNDRNGGVGCPYCSNREVFAGYNDLAATNPELAKEWHPVKNGILTPYEITAGSDKKVWWQCTKQKNHCWDANVYHRTNGNGCPYCAGKRISLGNNDLATTNPELVKEWHLTKNGKLTPNDVVAGSSRKVWWQCTTNKDHQWEAPVTRRSNGSGCPYCINQKVLRGYNDLSATHPAVAAEWHPLLNGDLTPFDVVAGSNKKVWWQCAQKHEWQAQLVERKRGRGHCRECAKLAKQNAKK